MWRLKVKMMERRRKKKVSSLLYTLHVLMIISMLVLAFLDCIDELLAI